MLQLRYIKPAVDISTDWISLSKEGILSIRSGYAWDGPSGPTIDTKNTMRGSLVHDALYQLMREGHISDAEEVRILADDELDAILKEDGMSSFRRWLWMEGLSIGGRPSAIRQEEVILEAP